MTEELFTLPDDADVYEVVQAFAAALDARPDDRTLLTRWTARYPRFSEDLIAFGYARFAFGWSLNDPVEDELEPAKVPLTSLVEEAKTYGYTPQQFARTLRLDTPLLTRLNQRLLDVGTVPRTLIHQMARLLDRSLEEITVYLSQPPRLAAGAQYKAKQAPMVRESSAPPSFADALDRLPLEDRDYWRAQIAAGGTVADE